MTDRRVDISKMYAHIYFDLASQGKLGVAVYSVASIPGFASKPGELVKEHYPEFTSGKELFLSTFDEKSKLSPEEVQAGKVFTLQEIEDKIPEISLRGKALADNPDADLVLNIDDPDFWASALPPNQRQHAIEARDATIQILSDPSRALHDALATNDQAKLIDAKQALHLAFQRLYVIVSRIWNPSTGSKQYPKRKNPPTILFSGIHNVAYYPGYRGSPYMSEVPKLDSKSIHTHREEPGKYWHEIVVDNIAQVAGHAPSTIQVEVLDQITEVLAQLFYKQIRKSANPLDLRQTDFNQALIPLRDKANTLLTQIDESDLKDLTTASHFIGTWIDLYTGQIFKSLAQLLAAKKTSMQELAKAAGVKKHDHNNI
jgi:hypothetical protein